MSNGDPLLLGLSQPPDNRTFSTTMLVHSGGVFGDQSTAFWVQRVGEPSAAFGPKQTFPNASGQARRMDCSPMCCVSRRGLSQALRHY